MKINVEVTDTFGGEANYCWVKRYKMEMPDEVSDRTIIRRVKAETGYKGVACRKEDMGDFIALYPRNDCIVIFITFDED